MRRWLLIPILGAVLVSQEAAQAPDTRQQLWQYRNLGKAFYENPMTQLQAVEEFRKALALAPHSAADRINYGLALLRAGKTREAIVELLRAQKQDPRNPRTWFNLGVAYKKEFEHPAAIEQLQGMLKLVPDEPATHYNLGVEYKLIGKSQLALEEFLAAEKFAPDFAAPHFQLYNAYRELGRKEDAANELELFNGIKKKQAAAAIPEDPEWSPYAEIFDTIERTPGESAPLNLKLQPKTVTHAADPASSGMVAIDSSGTGRTDLVVWSRGGIQLFRNGRIAVAQTGLEEVKNVIGIIPGDFNNDELPDLCVLTTTGAALYVNRGGRFEPFPAKLPAGVFTRALWIDFDHDYDLDLFLFGERSVLMRNEGEAGFADHSDKFPFVAGRVLDAIAYEAVPDTNSRDIVVSYADRPGVLYRDRQGGRYEAEALPAVPAGTKQLLAVDINNDGWMDLLAASDDRTFLFLNKQSTLRDAQELPGAKPPLVAVDLENRGTARILSNQKAFTWTPARTLPSQPLSVVPAATSLVAGDFEGSGTTDLVVMTADGNVELLGNRATGRSLRVALTGVKNLKVPLGAAVEVKAGTLYGKQLYSGVPLIFGLNGQAEADVVRVTWPNGLVQNETRQAAGVLAYKEKPRLSGSCPMIFAWDGRRFRFISDVLGVAPLGASDGDGHYFPVNHREHVMIPGTELALRGGHYELRITEELHEVSYLDQIQLIALDHPASVEVLTNDKFKGPPYPEFRLFRIHKRIYPQRATDDRGRNLLPAIGRRDGVYARGFTHDYAGVAQEHYIELDFGRAARSNRALLVLNGWVDWADGSTFLAAAQQGSGLIFPYLQVKDASGRWRTVIEDMGMPSGKPKSIVVDLTGKFLSTDHRVRIVTNLCVYWDEIFLSEDESAPNVRVTRLSPQFADLHFRGFSRTVIDPHRARPEEFLYQQVTPVSTWNPTPGRYTRYGEVSELLRDEDDRLVIMGSGDELRLRFEAAALPPLPAGWQRDFLVMVDGWAKDADSNTAFSQSVEPLPFHAMSAYPYSANEHFPDDEAHRRYRELYLTRPALRLLRPLASDATRSYPQNLQPSGQNP